MDLPIKALSDSELRDIVGGSDFVGLGGIIVPGTLPDIKSQ